MNVATKNNSRCLMVGILLTAISPSLVMAQEGQRECSTPPDTSTFTCGAQGGSCTKTASKTDPQCTANCPANALSCYCSLTNTPVATMTYSGVVTLNVVSKSCLLAKPSQDCPQGTCTLSSVITGSIPLCTYTCLDCTTSGPGVPGTRPGQICTSYELYP